MPLELVRVAAHEDGWSVRLADGGSLISVQQSVRIRRSKPCRDVARPRKRRRRQAAAFNRVLLPSVLLGTILAGGGGK